MTTRRLVGVLAGACLVGCGPRYGERARRLHRGLAEALRAPAGTAVRLDAVAPFAWDTAWVFGPYFGLVGPGSRSVHPAAVAAARTGISDRDDINAVVLMRGSTPVAIVAQERSAGDFAPQCGVRALPRAHAVLAVYRGAGDRRGTFAVDDRPAAPLDSVARGPLASRCR